MQTDQLISTKVFCTSHHIEVSFIHLLHESGLIEIIIIEEDSFIPADQLELLEKIVRFHFDMGINVEGIETVTHLLQRINSMQHEIVVLKNKLAFYEEESVQLDLEAD